MYQVIITDDETRERSYFYSYGEIAGNIETEELPPISGYIQSTRMLLG